MSKRNSDKRRTRDAEVYAARRAAYFEGKWCFACGSREDLELDHVDPLEKIDHRIWSWAEARRLAELAKCQVLCHACHIEKGVANGELTRGAKLDDDDVAAVRLMAALRGTSARSLADMLDVHVTTIRSVLRRASWWWVDEWSGPIAANAVAHGLCEPRARQS